MSQEISDEALCRRVAKGNEQAFDELVTRYQGRAYRIAWGILREAEDARDVAQDAFVRLYEAAGRFRGEARFSTWFYRIVVNLCLEHRRRGRWWRALVVRDVAERDGARLDRLPAPAPDPLDGASQAQLMTRVWAAVEGLSSRQRAALLLSVQEELSTSEIAAVLDCAEAAVRVHLHRAVMALRRSMAETG